MRNGYLKMCDYGSRFRILKGGKISLIVSAFIASTTLLHAAPSGGVVTSGSASIAQSGSVTNITQSTQKAAINWNNFSIGTNETVNFNQPNVSSVTLNRVVGNEKSIIDGALNAKGQVFILNSNGVLFSKNASINTAGLVATTMSLSDADFMNGSYSFKGDSFAPVINQGTINISDKGYATLFGKEVINEGVIKATLGKVELVGAKEVTLNLNGNSLVNLKVDKGVLDALVENKGALYADGGEVYLTTNAVNELLKGVVNNTGVIEANSIDDLKSEVILFAHGGEAKVGGIIKAEGGFVETSGRKVKIADNFIVKAKTWLIDPVDFTIASSGGDMTGATLSASLDNADVIIQSTSGGSGTSGDINVNDEITWNSAHKLTLEAQNNINITADITIEDVDGELALHYGQASVYANNTSDYILSGTIQTADSNDFEVVTPGNIIFTTGGKFTEKKGSNGPIITSHFKDVAYVTKEVVSDISDDSIQDDGVQGPITWTIRPTDTHLIAVKPTGEDYEIDDVGVLFNMTQDSVDYINSPDAFNGDTTNYSIAYQDIVLTEGQTITTAWNYTSTDYAPYNDGSFVSFVNTTNSADHTSKIYGLTTEVMVLGATVEGTGNWSTKSFGSTGWQTVSFTAGQAGTYRIGYAVFNLDDTSLSPFLVLDTQAGTVLKNGVTFAPLPVDPNGPLASAGIIITVPDATPDAPPPPPPAQDLTPIITQIVNNTAVQPPVVPSFTPPALTLPTLPQQFSFGGQMVQLMSTPRSDIPTDIITMADIRQMQPSGDNPSGQGNGNVGNTDIRVPLGQNSLIQLLNGGVRLPDNVEQEFFMARN